MRRWERAGPIRNSLESHSRVLRIIDRYLHQVDPALATITENASSGGLQVAPIPSASVAAHASTHKPATGSDALATAAAVTLHANTANATGTSDALARSGHTHAIATAAHSGGYGTTALVGTADGLLRADARMVFPEALGTLADRTKTLTLTDGGTHARLAFAGPLPAGAVEIALPAAGSFRFEDSGTIASLVANSLVPGDLRIFASPTGSQVSINARGHLGTAGTLASDSRILTFQASYADAALLTAIHATAIMTGTGGVEGLNLNVTNSGANAVALVGSKLTLSATGASTTGNMTGYNALLSFAGGAAHTTVESFRALAASLTGAGTITGYRGFVFDSPNTGTVTNLTGFAVASLATGTTRRGFWVQGATTGTPTAVVGFDVSSLAVGTDRWSFRGAQKFENTGTDMICSTAGKGFVAKDTQPTARFWRQFADATGVAGVTLTADENDFLFVAREAGATGNLLMKVGDVGTALPTS